MSKENIIKDLAEGRVSQKKRMLGILLKRGVTATVHLDSRRAAVEVPKEYVNRPDLALRLSKNFPNANTEMDKNGVGITLTFGGTPARCFLPWTAIWGIDAGDVKSLTVWKMDVPSEVEKPPEKKPETKLTLAVHNPEVQPDASPRAPWLHLVRDE